MEPYKTLFDNNCTIGQIYSRLEIIDILGNPNENPMRFTYNRWNIGQPDLNCFFEYLGNAKYKYLGFNADFTGPCYHHPQGSGYHFKIGDWLNGIFSFSDKTVVDFPGWKVLYCHNQLALNLYLSVLENCPFNLKNISLNTTEKRIICQSQNKVIEEFIVMKPESALAKLILNQTIENEFEFGPNKFKITKIYREIKTN